MVGLSARLQSTLVRVSLVLCTGLAEDRTRWSICRRSGWSDVRVQHRVLSDACSRRVHLLAAEVPGVSGPGGEGSGRMQTQATHRPWCECMDGNEWG
ncbi:hypothetical protein NDU88_001771 [Pleurodeles waltl]|uniref:Secreted protein n=1 Tax=Pleurodeles waltl TaxID=8319 RepID=A0AAV7R863_PLEWA|nr:hypothetical protein NDU88_001771 [Pleurodeles waltl]